MKKRWMPTTILLVAVLVLSGCGEVTLEEKITRVQEANTIKVQDVIDLMELEGLTVEKINDAEFQKQWSDAVLTKVNDTHYVALKSFDENLVNRKSASREIGWEGGFGVYPDEENNAVNYIGYTYVNDDINYWVMSDEFSAKNIVALVVPVYPENINELENTELAVAINKVTSNHEVLERVFYNDINGLISEDIILESENFSISGTLSYYATGVVDENAKKEWTYYDTHTWFNGTVLCADAVFDQYIGHEISIALESPDNWSNTQGTRTNTGLLDEEYDKMINVSYYTDDILWKAPEGKPIYVMTIKIGDIEETVMLEPTVEIE